MFYSFERCLPNFIHKKTLTVNPNRNPAIHWSGWSLINGRVTSGPIKKVSIE